MEGILADLQQKRITTGFASIDRTDDLVASQISWFLITRHNLKEMAVDPRQFGSQGSIIGCDQIVSFALRTAVREGLNWINNLLEGIIEQRPTSRPILAPNCWKRGALE